MREIDLHIQNETDKLDERISVFFQQCKKQKLDWRNDNFEAIKKDYIKLFENADDKIQIANQLYDLIEKYLKKLDQELQKFKLELEADHAGITSKLEQVISKKNPNDASSTNGVINALTSASSTNCLNFGNDDSDFTLCGSSTNDLLMMMLNNNTSSSANNLNDTLSLNHNMSSSNLLFQSTANSSATTSNHKRKHSILNEKTYLNQMNSNTTNLIGQSKEEEDSSSSWSSSRLEQQSSSSSNLYLNNNIHASNAVFHTTNRKNSKAISVNNRRSSAHLKTKKSRTTDNKPQSLIKKSRLLNDLDTYDDEAFGDDENARNDFYQTDDETGDEANEVESEINSEMGAGAGGIDNNLTTSDDDASTDLDTNKFKLKHGRHNSRPFKEDWNSSEDTNERYCICKDVSYGDMIACDNTRCGTQWFHFVCVGLNSAPKGKWYCPSCAEIKKKRSEKQLNSILNATSTLATPILSSNANHSIGHHDFNSQLNVQNSTNEKKYQ